MGYGSSPKKCHLYSLLSDPLFQHQRLGAGSIFELLGGETLNHSVSEARPNSPTLGSRSWPLASQEAGRKTAGHRATACMRAGAGAGAGAGVGVGEWGWSQLPSSQRPGSGRWRNVTSPGKSVVQGRDARGRRRPGSSSGFHAASAPGGCGVAFSWVTTPGSHGGQ